MLRWLVGRGTPSAPGHDEDSPDYPETPAPVFAAKAFKSVIFGTPAPKDDDTYEIAKAGNTAARESRSRSGSMSPTKRGILMTPGTAAARRKTVTFGENVESELKRESKSGIPDDCPGKFPSPWVSKTEDDHATARQTNLLKTLENARESTKKPTQASNNPPATELQPTEDLKLQSSLPSELDLRMLPKQKKAEDVGTKKIAHKTNRTEDDDLDFTVDLEEPRSQSGRHWKREYEKYHEEAQERMGHLMRYKELAKSYAKMKDDEAMEMREQLDREQQNVVRMENYIGKLIGAIEDRNRSGDSDSTPELTKELSRQTALATQYKEQVDQFRAALETGGVVQPASGRHADKPTRTEQALAEARQDLERAREQLMETVSLRTEAKRLRLDWSICERKAAKLREENLAMAEQLQKCSADLERSERKQKVLEEKSKNRGDTLQNLRNDYEALKHLAKKQRSDADLQLQQRHEQITTLRKELLSTRYVADSSESEKLVRTLQQKIAAHDKIVQEYEGQIARLRSQELKELSQFNLDSHQSKRQSSLHKVFGGFSNYISSEDDIHELATATDIGQQGSGDDIQEQDHTTNVDRLMDSVVPELQTPTVKRDYAHKENRSMLPTYKNSTTPRSPHSVLTEIINSPLNRGVLETNDSYNLASPNLSKRFSDLSLQSPAIPPQEAPLLSGPKRSRLSNDKISKASPRPSRFNIENTPIKPKQVSNITRAEQGPSRASRLSNRGSLRTRAPLPPERAAAAKARIEQRSRNKQQEKMEEDV